ncbi:HD domain-containing protein [Kitasatospora cineracea]
MTAAPQLTLDQVDALAARAHAGQYDRIGVPYVEHVRAVAAGVAPFGTGVRMAALLHDVLEDTPVTAGELLAAGVPAAVVATVRRVTRTAGTDYRAMLLNVATDHAATLVKIADNAHNSRADRAALLPAADRARLAERYRAARAVLWPAVAAADVRAIVGAVNLDLLAELD